MSESVPTLQCEFPTLRAFQVEAAETLGNFVALKLRSPQTSPAVLDLLGEFARRSVHYARCAGCEFCYRRRIECETALQGKLQTSALEESEAVQ